MVTRKPVARAPESNLSPESIPPYPVTPISTDVPPQFRMQDVQSQMASSATDSESNSANAWVEEGLEKHRNGEQREKRELPDSLRVGPPVGYTPKTSQEKLRQNTNPFLQRQQTGVSDGGKESSASAWGERPSEPSAASPQPPPEGMLCTYGTKLYCRSC